MSLFEEETPPGFLYRPDFISLDEEAGLAADISRVSFSNFEMRGVAARRRVAFFGRSYDAGGRAERPLPDFLLPLREKLGNWIGLEPHDFAMSLINEYPAGAPIGWHRDAPQYDVVVGVSLLSSCRMKFRPYRRPGTAGGTRTATHEIHLGRRSAYVMRGPSRIDYEHHIPAVKELRYSITFRTLR